MIEIFIGQQFYVQNNIFKKKNLSIYVKKTIFIHVMFSHFSP